MSTLPVFRTLVSAATFALAAALSASSLSAETVDTISKSFQVKAGGKLSVDVDAGSIEVRTGAGHNVSVEVVRKFRDSSKEKEEDMIARHVVTIEQSGHDVTIHARGDSPTRSMWSWFGGGGKGRDVRYTITVPENYHADLKTSGGPIRVSDLRGTLVAHTSGGPLSFAGITGPISGGTSGGPIDLDNCAGDVELHTSGGGIDSTNGRGTFALTSSGGPISINGHKGRITAKTSGGGIDIDRIDGEVDASTSGGPVHASFRSQPTGDCRLHTSGGGISLNVPASAAFTLNAHSTGGGVHCSLPGGETAEKSRGKLRASYNGGGAKIDLSSSGGGIDIDASRGVEG